MLDTLGVKQIRNTLNSEEHIFLNSILKEENPEAILVSLSKKLLNRYFQILIKSENIFLYFCEYKKENVGYAILSKKPSFLINEFNTLKYSILIDLIIGLKVKTLMNIFLSVCKIDIFLLSKGKKNFINDNLNLHLLAVKKNYQSQGIGKEFVSQILNNLKKNYNFKGITVETYSQDAGSFYQKKLDFVYLGKKLRFFKNLYIFKKDF
jgi:ribosomal protein S18 acetylase RimI-like enzyme|tara:strand:- start:714 stop:1337 length:624 start_codon:yes stop_codon:yes gene_type:complete